MKQLLLLPILALCACLTGCGGCNGNSGMPAALPLFLPAPQLAADAPWPMWQHDPSHSGRSPYNGPAVVSSSAYADLCCFGLFGSPVVDGTARAFIGTIRSGNYATICDALAYPALGASGLLHGIGSSGASIAGFPFDSRRGSVLAAAIECAPLLLDDGSIVFGKDDGYMYRVSAGGRLLWDTASDDPFNPSAPADDNEQMIPSPLPGPDSTVYFLSHFADVYGPGPVADAVELACPAIDYFKTTATPWYSKLYALDVRGGRRRWTFDPAGDPASGGQPMVGWGSPALGADGSVIIGLMHTGLSGDHYVPTTGRVFAVGQDGSRAWVFPADGNAPLDYSLWASPAVSPAGAVYIGASDYTYLGGARLYSLTAEGLERWHYELPENTIAAAPALRSDGSIIVATQNRHLTDGSQRYGVIYALADHGDHAEQLWRYPAAGTIPGGFFSSPLVDASDRVYVANEPFPYVAGSGVLLGLDTDGGLLFSQALDGYVHGNLALGSDGTLYVPLHQPPRLVMVK